MQPLRVLIVEDDAIIGWALRRSLAEMGHEVCAVVPTAQAALDAAQVHHPHLALVDIRLQGDVDGIETARRLRRDFDVPAIFLTAFVDEFENAREVDSYGYLVKPYTNDDLTGALAVAEDRLRREDRLGRNGASTLQGPAGA